MTTVHDPYHQEGSTKVVVSDVECATSLQAMLFNSQIIKCANSNYP